MDRIKDLKIYFDIATMILEDIQERYIGGDDSYFGSMKAYAETLKNQMTYYAEIEYLQGLVEKIHFHPEI